MGRNFKIIIILIFTLIIISSEALAGGGCPQTADRLEEFAGCLVQTRSGAVPRGSSSGLGAHMDDDHRELLGAMAANSGVPPQVMPPSAPIIGAPFMPVNYFYPIYPATGANIWFYTGSGLNPYVTVRYSVPLY